MRSEPNHPRERRKGRATHSCFFWAVEQVDYIPGKRWGVEHGRSLGGIFKAWVRLVCQYNNMMENRSVTERISHFYFVKIHPTNLKTDSQCTWQWPNRIKKWHSRSATIWFTDLLKVYHTYIVFGERKRNFWRQSQYEGVNQRKSDSLGRKLPRFKYEPCLPSQKKSRQLMEHDTFPRHISPTHPQSAECKYLSLAWKTNACKSLVLERQPSDISNFVLKAIKNPTWISSIHDSMNCLSFAYHDFAGIPIFGAHSLPTRPMCVWIVWVGLYGWGRWNFVLSSRKSAMGNTAQGESCSSVPWGYPKSRNETHYLQGSLQIIRVIGWVQEQFPVTVAWPTKQVANATADRNKRSH